MNKKEIGLKNLVKIDGAAAEVVFDSLKDLAPDLNDMMLEFAFGTIYEPGVLNFKQREMITITSLLTQGGCENQLRVHIQASLNVGLTQEEIIETFIHCVPYVGFPRVLNAIFVAKEIFTDGK
ncbi:carboxymuconolactone decarboxylase family protein [Lactococcus lactis]|uniref:carboxymuconolactone decarboxylase family protein n=1 Tax=Lactococcus lactis TaxID=1358 RepID=UPI002890CDD9|nr:carboxymuconolactone decarboxylase family protein [Lactococcus lactis]MDT2859707.1 carboxymuconolactone decarboxylase family protein [Lactococcus lactis]MDT2878765.1 carboxymuconolactone decarboxylase family protein [Lactococcus lactis]MDT2908799.1 carboxymuconolactone decarboxylase family protein [Lactococcus lactis]MDT2916475.1 carboxymuconolactone decarboxylase family protein [Lactococcus lactis]MDT2924606.1 carboxymuconolactone decarboxylase family protein [Lactococcus lactis]